MQLIDTHCHLTHHRFQDDVDVVIQRAQESGVQQMITIGTGLADGLAASELAKRWPGVVWNACGLDPFSLFERPAAFDEDLAQLAVLLREQRCIALGEVGLEYFHQVLPPARQQECLHQQLALAESLALPVVIHVRDAHPDMQAILGEHPAVSGVIHSFDGAAQDAAVYLELGWMLSFNGMATFKKKDYLREALLQVPDERLLVETDSPFLAPTPLRGKRCEPGWVRHTLEALAAHRQQGPEHLAAVTTANARALFDFTTC